MNSDKPSLLFPANFYSGEIWIGERLKIFFVNLSLNRLPKVLLIGDNLAEYINFFFFFFRGGFTNLHGGVCMQVLLS